MNSSPQLELLKKISDTLGVLGLGELRQRVQDEIAAAVRDRHRRQDASRGIADQGGRRSAVGRGQSRRSAGAPDPARGFRCARSAELPADQDLEFKLVSEAVLRECIVNMARIKEAVSIAVQKPGDSPPQGLDNVPQLLRGITAGLLDARQGQGGGIDGRDRHPGAQADRAGRAAPDAIRLERVADAIVSIEYYMETLQSGRNDPWYMLDNAEMCIKTLADEAPSRVPDIGISSSEAAKTVKLDPAETIALERTKRRMRPPIR